MESYYEVRAKLANIEELFNDISSVINKAEEWTLESICNCTQQDKIEESLSDIKDKVKKADNELADTMRNLRR